MPLSADDAVNKVSTELVDMLKGAFHTPPGYRPGIMLDGMFEPTALASKLSSAQHFTAPSTPVMLRFSSSTGLPNIPDTDPNGNPRGCAVRFILGDRAHTDLIAHSTPFFPSRTGADFRDLFSAIGDGSVGTYLESHPAAKAFVTAPKPFPVGFDTEKYWGLNAYYLVDHEGRKTAVRFEFHPAAERSLSDDDVKSKSEHYLTDELKSTIAKGPIVIKLVAQVAEEGDILDDVTVHWPATRQVVELGQISLTKIRDDTLALQKTVIYDPVPRVKGVEPSDDPLIDVRASVYLISGRQRREAPLEASSQNGDAQADGAKALA